MKCEADRKGITILQRIMRNWIFTLVMAIVLALVAIWMLLDGVGVFHHFFTQQIIHEITGVFLACYTVLVLCIVILPRYGKRARLFTLVEIAILLAVTVGIFANSAGEIEFIEEMTLCAVFGLVIWLRSAITLLNAYMTATDDSKRAPIWLVCLYILAAALGVWQMASPSVGNRYLIFPIAILTILIAGGFAVLTMRNRKALPAKPAAKESVSAPEEEAAITDGTEQGEPAREEVPAQEETPAQDAEATEEPKESD